MNAVEIEQAITDLGEQPFDPATFPYAFLEAFGNKDTTINRLRAGASNKSDLGGVLQTNNIHILTCDAGQATKALKALKDSPASAKAKAKFILATDGTDFEAEDLASGETVACAFKDFPDHFGFFLPLAGISTVRQITENAFDIRATTSDPRSPRRLFSLDDTGQTIERQCAHINAYLAVGESVIVEKASRPPDSRGDMTFGNMPLDGGHLLLSRDQRDGLQLTPTQQRRFVRRIYGSAEFIRGLERYCLWINDEDLAEAKGIPPIAQRIENVRRMRLNGGATAKELANRPHQFQRTITGKQSTLIVPRVSSETREYLPCGYEPSGSIASDAVCAMYDAPLWNMALIASRLHLVWIAAVCGKLETRYRYSNTLGWNTFPVPTLTEKNKADLTRCAEDILLAREHHFPATIADLYNPEDMPADLRAAHERNDEVLERIYIGRRFKNDTERLEKLFDLYTKMTATTGKVQKGRKAGV